MTSPPLGRRWLMLGIGLVSLITACAAQYGYAFLVPALRAAGFSLTDAAGVITAPILGVVAGLVAWGWAADRWGERIVLATGLVASGAALLAAAQASRTPAMLLPLLFTAGATSSAVHAASGRLILGWFASRERGLAMGIRQTGQPLGMAMAALTLPLVAGGGIDAALRLLAAGCLGSGLLVGLFVRDPVHEPATDPRAAASSSPYRSAYLWRIHAASGLLVISQVAVFGFAFDFLVTARGWAEPLAGAALAVAQVTGAAGRIGAGWWSDRTGSRLGPMRILAAGIALTMAALGGLAAIGTPLGDAAILVAAVITVSPNGLAFTAVAECAGRAWAGRALGIQNTFQNLVGAGVPPAVAGIVALSATATTGYALAFAAAAAFPLLAVGAIPVHDEYDSAT